MSIEIMITDIPSVTQALQVMARRLSLSITALVNTGGVENGSLTSIGTGRGKTKDMAIGPFFRILQAVGWEMVGRVKDPRGIIIQPEGGIELLVTGADGGRIEVTMSSLQDVPLLLNTMAAANAMTISGLNKAAGLTGGSLVGIAKGTSSNQDIRLSGLSQITERARFELLVRPVHETRRAARIALATARRS